MPGMARSRKNGAAADETRIGVFLPAAHHYGYRQGRNPGATR